MSLSTPKTQPHQIQELTSSVEGFLSQNGKNLFEGEVLYYLAKKSKGKIVEIGSWKGKSTIWIGKGSESGLKNHVYAIDPHTGSQEHRVDGKPVWTFDVFKENIIKANLADLVIPVVMPSKEGAKEISDPVNFVFIDGAHDYLSVKQDFDIWMPKIQREGTVAFHDSFGSGWPGVRKLVHEEVFKSPYFKHVRYINGITYAIKVERATFQQRLENYFSLLVKKIHEKSLYFPQPFKSLSKRLIWRPLQRKWLKELNQNKRV